MWEHKENDSMDFKNIIEKSWKNTLSFIGPLLLITFAQLLVIILSLGILAPVTTAGYIQSLLRAEREGRQPEVGDLFSKLLPQWGFYCWLSPDL